MLSDGKGNCKVKTGGRRMDKETLKDTIELVQHLKSLPALQFFGKEDLKRILRFSKLKKYTQGERIIEEGNIDTWVYFLISGNVKVMKHGEVIDAFQRTGDIFGEMCVIDGGPRSASVYAADDVVCLATDVSFVNDLVGDDQIAFCAIFYQIAAEVMARRLRETSEELVQEQVMKEIVSNRLREAHEELRRAKEEIARLKK
jgi:CRP/FNR family cyclic AMP-dependent transcriptional regulator